jgi:hypothetical protein
MPFKSKQQQKYLFSQKPKLAKEWADKYGVPKSLPQKAKSSPQPSKQPKRGTR